MMSATDDQLRAIAYLAAACRPYGARQWDADGIYRNLEKVRDRSLGSITIAAVQAAEDRNALTPGVISKPGPHWRTPEAAPITEADKVDASEHCATCGHTETACRIRWAGDHEFITVEAARAHKRPADAAAAIRDAVREELRPLGDRPDAERPTQSAITPGAGRARVDAAQEADHA